MPDSTSVSWEEAARALVFHLVCEHPPPWRVEQDWSFEVIAADGHVVAKCSASQDAEAIVEIASAIVV